MAKTYLIYCKEPCPQCDTTGVIDASNAPDQIVIERCFECNGDGVLHYEVSLNEALRNIAGGAHHG